MAWLSLAALSHAQEAPQFTRLEAFPTHIQMKDARAANQLVVSAYDAAGNVYDVTDKCQLTLADGNVAQVNSGRIEPKADGKTQLQVKLGDLTVSVEIEVAGRANAQADRL